MKKICITALVLIVGCGSLFAGGGQEQAGGAAAAQKTYNLKVASVGQIGDDIVQSLELFLKEVGEKTNGAITGQVFVASQLGSHRDYLDGMAMGSIQMAEITGSVISTVAPKFSVFDMPYISKSPQTLYNALVGQAGDILTQHFVEVAKVRSIGWIVRTPRHVYSSKGPINTVEDFRNLKIRTMESSPMLTTMSLFGAKATAIPTAERYMALQTRVVDAAENSVSEIYNCKEYEVTKYLSKTAHLIMPNVICIGSDLYDGMPADYQKIVTEAGRKAADFGTQYEIRSEKELEVKLTQEGMTINDIPDKSSFANKLAPLYQEYESVIGKDLLTLIQNQ